MITTIQTKQEEEAEILVISLCLHEDYVKTCVLPSQIHPRRLRYAKQKGKHYFVMWTISAPPSPIQSFLAWRA